MNNEIFKIVGSVLLKDEDFKKGVKGVVEEGEKTSSKLGNALSKVGNVAAKFGKAVAVGVGAAATGLVALTKTSMKAYADYEQLVGGVETLFKNSSDKVLQYANNAYKTAGLSANEYMETVTSFSASLLQSLNGDTAKSAEVADMAITDMADNANKMGTSMESIQFAYQGFAKQNYTMLDNLKLGYGGTKEEMERLLKDAEKLSGQKYDISNLKDVYQAIHVIQGELGITGTTAKEASETISGSLASMKASWVNLITGLGMDQVDLEGLIGEFVDSVETALKNLIPRIEIIIEGIVELVGKIFPMLIDQIGPMTQNLIPAIVNGIIGILNAIVSATPMILQTIVSLGFKITQEILDMLPLLIDTIITILGEIIYQLGILLPQVVNKIVEVIPQLIDVLIDCIPYLIETAAEFFLSIIKAIPMIIETLSNSMDQIISSIINGLIVAIPDLIQGAITLLMAIIDAIPIIIRTLLPMIPTIVKTVVKGLIQNLPVLLDGAVRLFMALVEAIPLITVELVKMLPLITTTIIDTLLSLLGGIFEPLWDATKEPLQDFIDGIISFFQGLWKGIKAVFDGIIFVIKIFIGSVVSIFDAAFQLITLPFRFIWENCKEAIMTVFNAIASFIQTIINTIWTVLTTYWSFIFNTISSILNAIWTVISNVWNTIVNVIRKVITTIWNVLTTYWSFIFNTISSILNAIWTVISSVWNTILGVISSVVNSIKNIILNVFNGIKNTVTNIWIGVMNAIKKPIEKARDLVKNAIDKIKGFFSFQFKWPKLKMPHFNVKPKGWEIGDLLKGKIPKLGIDWYSKGAIFDKPTLFDTSSGVKGVGEAGPEAVAPISELMKYTQLAVEGSNEKLETKLDTLINLLTNYLPMMMNMRVVMDTGELVGAISDEMDKNLGNINRRRERGN